MLLCLPIENFKMSEKLEKFLIIAIVPDNPSKNNKKIYCFIFVPPLFPKKKKKSRDLELIGQHLFVYCGCN